MCYIPLLRFQSQRETCVSRSSQSNNARASASYYSRRHGGNHLGALPHPALAAGCHSPPIPCEQPRLCRGPFPASAARLYTIWSVKDLRQDVHVLRFTTLDSHKGPLPRKAPLESSSGVFCISVCAIRPVQLSSGGTHFTRALYFDTFVSKAGSSQKPKPTLLPRLNVMGKTERPVTEEEVYTAPRKGGVMNKLYPPGPKPGAGGRVKNHCRKFWWCGKSHTVHYTECIC